MLQILPEFKGYFNHLFELNDLSYFDEVQFRLEQEGVKFKGLFLYDIIVSELLRRQLGIVNFAGLDKISQVMLVNPLSGILHDPFHFPTASDISYILNQIDDDIILAFFHRLVDEAISLKIIEPRILLWDGQFVRTNCSNNYRDEKAKKLKQYNDPEAGYHRHNGMKNGVGYEASNLYCYCGSWQRVLPVYFEMFAANRNENPIVRETLKKFHHLHKSETWKFIIMDSGGYSHQTLNCCKDLGYFPLIRAKKNLKSDPTKELKKGFYFNTNYFPLGWSEEDILKFYAIRPAIEAGQSANNTFYQSRRLNTRSKRMATINRGLTYILDLLRAITAIKLGRSDLLIKLSAFSATREHMQQSTWVHLAEQSKFQTLLFSGFSDRQKIDWHRRQEFESNLEKK